MNTWYSAWLNEKLRNILGYILVLALVASTVAYYVRPTPTPTPDVLKDFKDGIQNHLVWSIKGECFFVRPHAETTIYLIRVADCDRK
jgi:hypothetical protein